MTKTAIVTGSSGNLGPVWCETLLEREYRVFKYDLPAWDVTSVSDVQKAVSLTCGYGQVPSVIVNNAAIDNPPGSEASFFGNFQRIIDVNLVGAVNVTAGFLPHMVKNGGGLVVNIGSIQGNIGADWRNYPEGFEKPVGYNCSKAAFVQLSRSIAVQYGRYNIRSVTLSFSAYDGGKLEKSFLDKFLRNVPLNRPISKESLKAALRFALDCPELTGQQVLIDGGYVAL